MEPSRGNKRKKTQDALYEAGDLHQDASGHGAARDNHSDALSWHTSFEGCPPQGYQDARSAFAAPSSSQLRFQAIAGSQPSGVVAVDHHADPGHGFSLSANGYFSSGSGTVLYNEPVQLGAASISAPDQRVVPFGAFNSAIHDQNTVAQYDSSVFGNIAFDSTSSRGREQHVLMGETQYVPAEPAAEYAQYPNYAMHISGPVYPQQMASATGTVCPGVVVSQKDQGQDGRKQSQSLVAKIATDFVHADDNSTTTNDKKQPVKRTALTVSPKRKKGDTPKVKTCLRCRVQKIRCVADDNSDECLQCQGFSKVSKKTIHRIACYRGKLPEVTLFRRGGLNFTDRWQGTEMRDVGDRVASDTHTIEVTLGFCEKPMVLKVVRFHATERDAIARYWTVREGENGDEVRKKKDLEPYCLVDIWATAKMFEKYIIDNAISTMVRMNKPHPLLRGTPAGNDVIQRTYIAAVEYYLSMEDELDGPSGKIVNPQKRLLGNVFILWLAIRHTTGSAYICGEDTLGMKPETKDETYPLFGKVSLPRMIIAQFDSINSTRMLNIYGRKVLRDLEAYVFRNQSTWWWTIYLCFFIFLREASWISGDRYRHARAVFGTKYRYTIPKFVEELQDGCNNILVHWHYYNCHPWPDPEQPWSRHKHFMGELSSAHYDLVMETLTDSRIQKQLAVWKYYKDNNGTVKTRPSLRQINDVSYVGQQMRFDWDHPCYWVAQMFEEKWSPHPTYQREYND